MKYKKIELIIKKHLLIYDAPLVVYAEDQKGNPFIGINYGDGDSSYLFYFSRIKESNFELFCQQRIDARYLVTNLRIGLPQFGEGWATLNDPISTISHTDIDEDLLPESGMFIPQLEPTSLSTRNISIDGRWGIEDMSRFSDLIQDSYAFVYALIGKGTSATKWKMGALFNRYPWRGGFSSVNFFNDLYKLIPINERAEIRSIKYASPGTIRMNMDDDVADLIRSFVDDLNNQESIGRAAYKEARDYLKAKGWLGKAKDDIEFLAQDKERLLEYIVKLSNAFNLEAHVDDIVRFSNSDPLGSVKILLAYFRRLSGLADYAATGKAQNLFFHEE